MIAARRDALIVAVAKALVMGVVLATGFRAVSDDDYARVVIAEQWAAAPRLDPSGTSWLPLPFWITGLLMKVFGRGLDVARAGALVQSLAAALGVYQAARWMGLGRSAVGGAVAAAVFPWSARLGVATVPELTAAALVVVAIAALVPGPAEGRGARRLWGAAALVGATLSRYEAWPVAGAFAGFCLLDALRDRRAARAGALAAVIALAGPTAWLLDNRLTHGDTLHFVARVTAYRQALGGIEPGAPARLLAYPLAMVKEEPEIFALLAASIGLFAARRGVRELAAWLRPLARPAIVAVAQLMALSLAMLRDGAPTHHPERALLAGLILVAVAAGALAFEGAAEPGPRVAYGTGLAAVVALTAVVARPAPSEGFAPRPDEVAIGEAAARHIDRGERVLLEVTDYGYLATIAAFGRPEDTVPDRSIDPREARVVSSFDEAAALGRRMAAAGALAIIARTAAPGTATLGAPLATRGAFGLWRASLRSPTDPRSHP